MKKICEFFDKLEEKLESKHKRKKRMGYFTKKKIVGAFAFVEMDLVWLIIWITGADADLLVDYCFIIPLMIIGYIAAEICIHYLDKRIKAQETEEAAEDLEDDIADTAFMVVIIAVVVLFVLAVVVSKDARQDFVQWIQDW